MVGPALAVGHAAHLHGYVKGGGNWARRADRQVEAAHVGFRTPSARVRVGASGPPNLPSRPLPSGPAAAVCDSSRHSGTGSRRLYLIRSARSRTMRRTLLSMSEPQHATRDLVVGRTQPCHGLKFPGARYPKSGRVSLIETKRSQTLCRQSLSCAHRFSRHSARRPNSHLVSTGRHVSEAHSA